MLTNLCLKNGKIYLDQKLSLLTSLKHHWSYIKYVKPIAKGEIDTSSKEATHPFIVDLVKGHIGHRIVINT